MYLIFDTETTGLPQNYNAPITETDNWPRLVQLAWQVHDEKGALIKAGNKIIKPEGFTIPYNAEKIHGISTQRANAEGWSLNEVLKEFEHDVAQCELLIGHNIEFDLNIMGCEFYRKSVVSTMMDTARFCTKDETIDFVAIPGRGGRFKWPTLTELHTKLFGKAFDDAHDAAYDVDATARCFFGLIPVGVFIPLNGVAPSDVVYEAPKLDQANFVLSEKKKESSIASNEIIKENLALLKDVPFTHLHVHSQFSVLQAVSDISSLIRATKSHGMKAIAITDHGNMMGAFHFVKATLKEDLIPIIGCEFYITDDRHDKTRKNNGFQTVLLAKNKKGYHNLAKLASIAFVEGMYYVPRIDKEVLLQYKEDIIVLSGGLWGEIPFKILNVGEEKAEEAFIWWKEQFGTDFYVEINRHNIEEEQVVNDVLLKLCEKHKVKYIAANNTYYTHKKEANAHDVLLCVKEGEIQSKPKRYLGKIGREFRYGFPNDEFYIKSPDEMKEMFADIPRAIINTQEIVNKIEPFELARDVLLPAFEIPEKFQDVQDNADEGKRGENNFLRHLTYEGAKKRYDEITPDIQERIDFELSVIANTGYPGYFLIVQDFCAAAREMGVSVGPGRGSAAGSVVAYCTGITNVDPIKYDLLFERFLNPDRVSMPDIDIDFDDEGRQKVIDYVIEKYGSNQVAQIITYGTMAAKSAIRDTSRALDFPLHEADRLAKLVPDIKLAKLFGLEERDLAEKLKNNAESIAMANELKKISRGHDDSAKVINQARILEGSVRNTGIHACGVIITPDDLTNFVPVALAKDSDMYCTQFDNSVVESAGLLKMDFLGLKTLTLIKDAVKNVKVGHGIDLDPDTFSLEDKETYELFQRGETVGIFQYESPGMQKYLRELKPSVFADLIAMNALYRPGPLEYIPSFIKRKHGDEEIVYDLDDMKEYLEETYGITVYQEQVMLLSQKLAGFTKGEADMLRKAMGKKIFSLLEELKPKFINQAIEKGHAKDKLEKIWKDWEAFASYAFNKSHSTCYAWIAYQTAWLKAHYPAEYMASVLSNNMNDIKQVTFFMEECKRMGLEVLGPDINESGVKFTVNERGAIRFGLGAIKGTGESAVEALIEERNNTGHFADIFEFAQRVNLRQVNKKSFESLAKGGAFDCFGTYHRRQYIDAVDGGQTLSEMAIKYAAKLQMEAESNQVSMFGDESATATVTLPRASNIDPYTHLEQLNIEKEVVGLYITGHPLDQFKIELENICSCTLDRVGDYKNQSIQVAGIITQFSERVGKRGNPFGLFTVEDYSGSQGLAMFGEEYMKYRHLLVEGTFIFMKGVVQERYNQPGLWEFKPNHVEILSEVRSKYCKGVSLEMSVSSLNEEMISEIMTVCESNLGKSKLQVIISDDQEKIELKTFSRSIQINPTNEFFTSIDAIGNIEYTVLV